MSMKKLEYDYIKLEFAKEKYQFLAKKYINSYQKLEYICQKGHRHSISWNDWRYGARCPYCAGQGKPTMEFIKAEFKKEGQ